MTEFIKKESLINGRPNVYNQFLSNVISVGLQNNITPFPIDSVNGALTLSHFDVKADMVYIDAGHDYDSVVADLILYKDIVRPGGLLLGDDWFHGPIKQAVSDALGEVHTLSHDKFLWVKPE
jgi:predicted O-methyltransferase YrrM